ncbi:MAG: argininosuccinate synthase, partial [Candidatus Ruthia sp.]|nr:argininosuccinate synthase [Candidatus Ruthturnera sp.]
TVSPENAPDKAEYIEITYSKGDITAIDGEAMSPATVMEVLNQRAGAHGIGRDDIVENRFVGMKFAPEREMLQAAIDKTQETVNGTVRLKLYKGGITVVGRKSDDSLFSEKIATFEDDEGAYDQKDAAGFIKLNALRLRLKALK